MIAVGDDAPDFTLPDQDGNEVSLSDLQGQTSVLVFYPGDFSPVCTDQFNVYEEVLPELAERGVALYGVSVDSSFSHKAFQEKVGVTIPLLADFHPKGEAVKAYGLWSEEYGSSGRALVMIGPDLEVVWAHEANPLEVPGPNLIFDALDQVA